MPFGVEDGASRYQETLVPLMFASSAKRLVAAASLPAGAQVLDVATGTGIVAREAAAVVGSSGRVIALDSAAGMLEVARAQPPQPGAGDIEYMAAAIESAPLVAASMHSAFCQQGLQFFDDPVAALRHVHAALVPGGRVHVALWDTMERHPLSAAMHRALVDAGTVEHTWLLKRAHRLHDPAAVARMFEEARFHVERHDAVDVTPVGLWRVGDARRILAATPLSQRLAGLNVEQRSALAAATEHHLEAYSRDGILELAFAANFYTARREG